MIVAGGGWVTRVGCEMGTEAAAVAGAIVGCCCWLLLVASDDDILTGALLNDQFAIAIVTTCYFLARVLVGNLRHGNKTTAASQLSSINRCCLQVQLQLALLFQIVRNFAFIHGLLHLKCVRDRR